MIDPRAALALDDIANGVALFDDQQSLVERIHNRSVDCGEAHAAESAAILENVTADQVHAGLVNAFGLRVQLREAPVGTVLGEDPIERADSGDLRLIRCAARQP